MSHGPKITVRLQGGLGNQMFQYAAGRALALERDADLFVDPSLLFDVTPRKEAAQRRYALNRVFAIDPAWNVPAKIASVARIPYFAAKFFYYYPRLLGTWGHWAYVNEQKPFTRDPRMREAKGDVYLDGYWQTEKYFKAYEQAIRRDFSFRCALTGQKAALAREIAGRSSACLNVRRQEFVRYESISRYFNVATPEFYREAVSMMKRKAGRGLKIFIFSDEIDWCRENLTFDVPHMFVGYEHAGVEFRDYLQLMSLCRHFIIPNSTFAWWAAWLGTRPGKIVIAPKIWLNDPAADTRDATPPEWMRI